MTTTLKQRFALLAERNPKISQAYLAKVTGAKPPSVNGWHLPAPSGLPEICKWFTLSSDHPRLRLNRGNKVAINPEPDLSAYVDGQLCLFRTKAGAYILGDFRRLGDGFEAIPDSGLPLESERHHIQAVGIVKGTWFA